MSAAGAGSTETNINSTNLLKSMPPSGDLFAGIKKNIPDGKTSGMFFAVLTYLRGIL